MPESAEYVVRDYAGSHEPSWVRCRALAFFSTAYFDDVVTAKPAIEAPGFELVALHADQAVVGLMDVAVDGTAGVIETLAVHPDHQRRGIARALLAHAISRGHAKNLTALSAWTRDDAGTLDWYRTMGFTETDHYLHVFADHNADGAAFFEADLAQESELRERFARVHVCRRFTRAL
jgi:ribosomal protein S18 acetylase RimI-like enzyme